MFDRIKRALAAAGTIAMAVLVLGLGAVAMGIVGLWLLLALALLTPLMIAAALLGLRRRAPKGKIDGR